MKKRVAARFLNIVTLVVSFAVIITLWKPLQKSLRDYVLQPITVREVGTSDHAEKYYFSHLTAVQQQAYALIYDGVTEFREEVWTPRLTEPDFNAVHEAIAYDNPELFHLKNTCTMIFKANHCLYCPEYLCAAEEYDKMYSEVRSVREEIYSHIPPGADDYTKEKIIHDQIISRCTYQSSEWDSGVYGALVKGQAVCAGYARAAQFLLNGLNIPNHTVVGTAGDDGKLEKHMWNTVILDGKPYYLDVTWDDGDYKNGAIGYTYFNLSEDAISVTHFPENPKNSGCNFDEDNYFVRENRYFIACDADFTARYRTEIQKVILEGKTTFSVCFSSTEICEQAVELLIEQQEIYDIFRQVQAETGIEMNTEIVNYAIDCKRNILRLDLTENMKA